ncbi:MAG TPA: hypothetical protein VLK37_12205 [Solirubrobacterales bacterium]|nr:hypothetical protein [Solirubrobacterales bacterium]
MTRNAGGRNAWTAVGLFVIGTIGVGLLARGLYPVDLPESRDPNFVDNVFDNRAVLLAARLLLVSAAAVLAFGGLFIVVSIGNRMRNREWLRRAGPFEISEGKLAEAEEEIHFWRKEAMANEHEVIALRQLLESTDELAANLPDPK